MKSLEEILDSISENIRQGSEELGTSIFTKSLLKALRDEFDSQLDKDLVDLSNLTGIDIKVLRKMLEDCKKNKEVSVEKCLKQKVIKYKLELAKKKDRKPKGLSR